MQELRMHPGQPPLSCAIHLSRPKHIPEKDLLDLTRFSRAGQGTRNCNFLHTSVVLFTRALKAIDLDHENVTVPQ